MGRNDRTRVRPYISLDHHGWKGFQWDITLSIGSSGYVHTVKAYAVHTADGSQNDGCAWVEVRLGDDVQVAVEACVIEAAAAAATPLLWVAETAVKQLRRDEVFGS